jgi:uncharacterized protein YjbI with pentapeptide repeats
MKQEELNKILEAHKKWLNNESGGICADLHDTDLRNADLRNANLRGADLRYADLSNADLWGACLSNADLSNTNLSNVDVRKLVKSLVWRKDDDEDMWYRRFEKGNLNLIDLVIIKEDGEYTFGYGGNVGFLPAHKTLESCQQFVQDWLVSLVANACGSEVRNG